MQHNGLSIVEYFVQSSFNFFLQLYTNLSFQENANIFKQHDNQQYHDNRRMLIAILVWGSGLIIEAFFVFA